MEVACNIDCAVASSPDARDADLYFAEWDIALIVYYFKRYFTFTNVPQIFITGEGYHYFSTSLLRLEVLESWFDGVSTLSINSDVPFYMGISMKAVAKIESNKEAKHRGAFVSSNCGALTPRLKVAQIISEKIPIDIYGKCNPNKSWPKCGEKECTKIQLLQRYKLYLAFENGINENYVTEKIHDGYRAGTLPVYFGTKAIKDYVPEHSFINVEDFRSPKELGDYLVKVLEDEELYQSYFEWKKRDFSKEYLKRWSPIWEAKVMCRVCRYAYAKKHNLFWNQIEQNFDDSRAEVYIPTQHPYSLPAFWFIISTSFSFLLLNVRRIRLRLFRLLRNARR